MSRGKAASESRADIWRYVIYGRIEAKIFPITATQGSHKNRSNTFARLLRYCDVFWASLRN